MCVEKVNECTFHKVSEKNILKKYLQNKWMFQERQSEKNCGKEGNGKLMDDVSQTLSYYSKDDNLSEIRCCIFPHHTNAWAGHSSAHNPKHARSHKYSPTGKDSMYTLSPCAY